MSNFLRRLVGAVSGGIGAYEDEQDRLRKEEDRQASLANVRQDNERQTNYYDGLSKDRETERRIRGVRSGSIPEGDTEGRYLDLGNGEYIDNEGTPEGRRGRVTRDRDTALQGVKDAKEQEMQGVRFGILRRKFPDLDEETAKYMSRDDATFKDFLRDNDPNAQARIKLGRETLDFRKMYPPGTGERTKALGDMDEAEGLAYLNEKVPPEEKSRRAGVWNTIRASGSKLSPGLLALSVKRGIGTGRTEAQGGPQDPSKALKFQKELMSSTAAFRQGGETDELYAHRLRQMGLNEANIAQRVNSSR